MSDIGAIGFFDWLCASCMTILIGGMPANQCSVWEGRPSFLVFMCWSTGMRLARLAVIMSVQDEFICVCLVMPRCKFSMQLFLSEVR